MSKFKESSQEARQGEISPKKPVLRVLLVSTVVAGVILLLAATYMV